MVKDRAEELVSLRQRIEQLRKQRERARGALEQGLKRLREEYGCNTLEEGRERLLQLRKESEEARKSFDEALHAFQSRWSSLLDQGEGG